MTDLACGWLSEEDRVATETTGKISRVALAQDHLAIDSPAEPEQHAHSIAEVLVVRMLSAARHEIGQRRAWHADRTRVAQRVPAFSA